VADLIGVVLVLDELASTASAVYSLLTSWRWRPGYLIIRFATMTWYHCGSEVVLIWAIHSEQLHIPPIPCHELHPWRRLALDHRSCLPHGQTEDPAGRAPLLRQLLNMPITPRPVCLAANR
jgi:hypothetical protein